MWVSPAGSQVCHSKHCEETPPELLATPLVCHSEGGRSPTEESLLYTRDSTPLVILSLL
ncbi:hypothetical protein [Helicobacter marmotae]|uniref:hypothetical protein n=1 Tax=Helicobacter marmotae TaxID=152490 RepID=UPI0013153727|nr:hypothetical protein [Helicobacter marmotae]